MGKEEDLMKAAEVNKIIDQADKLAQVERYKDAICLMEKATKVGCPDFLMIMLIKGTQARYEAALEKQQKTQEQQELQQQEHDLGEQAEGGKEASNDFFASLAPGIHYGYDNGTPAIEKPVSPETKSFYDLLTPGIHPSAPGSILHKFSSSERFHPYSSQSSSSSGDKVELKPAKDVTAESHVVCVKVQQIIRAEQLNGTIKGAAVKVPEAIITENPECIVKGAVSGFVKGSLIGNAKAGQSCVLALPRP